MKPEIVMWQYRHFNSDGLPYGWISHNNEKDWAGSLRGHAAANLNVESRELVTHADYMALDDDNRSLKLAYFDAVAEQGRLQNEITTIRAPLEQFMRQWESDIQFYNGLDGDDLKSWAELFIGALKEVD